MKFKKLLKAILISVPFLASCFVLSSCKNDENNDAKLRSFQLCEQLNTFIRDIKIDGTMEEMEDIWFGKDETKKVIDYTSSGENGTITFASVLSSEPMGYISEGKKMGFSTDLVYRFAKKYGYNVQFFDSVSHATCVTAVASGRADFGGTCMSITEERRHSGCFSDPYYKNEVVVLTTKETANTIESMDELNGMDFGVASGSTYSIYCNEKMPYSNVFEYNTNMDAIKDLSDGKIKAVVIDKPIADYIINNEFFPNVINYGNLGYSDDFAFYFPKFAEQSLDYYADKRIGTVTGSVDEQYIKNKLPNAKILYYDSLVDCATALASGKVDAYADETASFIYNKDQMDLNVARIPENLGDCTYGFIFPNNGKGTVLKDDFNVFLTSLKMSGELERLTDKWLYNYETARNQIDYTELTGSETLNVHTLGMYPPFSYVKDGEITGFEVEILSLYAKSRGKKLQITLNNLAGILASAENGSIDIGFSMLTYSEDRATKMHFSDSYFDYNIFLVTSVGKENNNFFNSIYESFRSTFVIEQRWKLFLSGFLTTLAITIISILVGTILGFLIYLLVRESKIAKKVLKVCDYIITGMPVVVLLMIVYYVLFAKSRISATAISIGVFSLLFTSAVTKALIVSVNGVNKNQTEAYLALGYHKLYGFFRFILPQALESFFSLYKTEVVNLLKATAIVGYIAIQDLTKMSDIVRSRTYEAFFPLITLALMYFLLSFLLVFLVKKIELIGNKKRRKPEKILKGVGKNED